jgi:hypothetical protein
MVQGGEFIQIESNLKSAESSNIVYIEVEGSHYDMGVQQGKQIKDIWEKFYEEIIHSDLVAGVKPKIMPMGLLLRLFGWFSKRMLKPVVSKNTPNQHQKILGLAKGLDLRKNFEYVVNFSEIITGHPKLTMTWPNGMTPACTQLIALSKATTDGNDYLARNYDFPNDLEEYQMVRVARPDEGYKTIGSTQVCTIGMHQGMNEKGLAIAQNYGRGWRKDYKDFRISGIPAMILIQETLETCSTMEEAVEYISKFPKRGNGAFYGILDKQGNACLLETTASRHAIRYLEEGILPHTNLYMTEELMDANVPDEVLWKTTHMTRHYYLSPQRRYERAHELINRMKGKLNRKELYNILCDHNNREPDDDTICTHGEVGSSLATITCVPKKMEFWVNIGKPCTGTQTMFKLD